MYSTQGIEAIATITELRSKTTELIDRAKEIESGIMIQKNNEPFAVLISFDRYLQLTGQKRSEALAPRAAAPKAPKAAAKK